MFWSYMFSSFGLQQISGEKELSKLDPWSGAAWGTLLLMIIVGIYIVNDMRKQMVTKEEFDKAVKAMTLDLGKDINLAVMEVEKKLSDGLTARFQDFLSRRELDLSFASRDLLLQSLSRRLERIESDLEKHPQA